MKSHNCPHISHHLVFFKDHFVLMVLWSGSHLRFWPREQIGVVCNVSPSTLGDNTMIILHIIIIILVIIIIISMRQIGSSRQQTLAATGS